MNPHQHEEEDERLAAALQQQYRMEFLQRQSEKQFHQSSNSINNNTSSNSSNINDINNNNNNNISRSRRVLVASAPPAPTSSEEEEIEVLPDDEAYARRLQQQLDREAASSAASAAAFTSTRNNNHSFSPQVTNVGFGSSNGGGGGGLQVAAATADYDVDDAKYAQQLQDEEIARQFYHTTHTAITPNTTATSQELADAEMAHRIAGYEQEAAARRSLEEQRLYNRRQYGCWRRLCPLLTLVIAITIPLLFVFGVFTTADLGLDNFGNDWIESDPWGDSVIDDMTDPNGSSNITVARDAVRWPNKGKGLKLEILNAMQSKYDSILQVATANWDAGSPIDSLTLRITKTAYDYDCVEQMGLLKMCNGDYGSTKWRGINEVGLDKNRFILYSTARINDYYLDNESDDQKQYTICHEMGHGFGLPHWDTDFYNKGKFFLFSFVFVLVLFSLCFFTHFSLDDFLLYTYYYFITTTTRYWKLYGLYHTSTE